MRKRVIVFLIVYVVLHLVLRVMVSSALEKDEAEMVLQFQQPFQLGYNSQPPLYTWIQMTVFYLLGPSVFSLALLKNIFIFLLYLFIYLAASKLLRNDHYAAFSALALLLVYNFSWIMHKDMTHTILLLTICAATWYCLVRLFIKQSLGNYCFLGACIGLGMLAKYNYGIFIVALVGAAVCVREFRHLVFDRRFIISLLVAVMLVAPHAVWASHHEALVLVDKEKLNMAQGGRLLGLQGIGALAREAATFLGPLCVFFLLVFRKGFTKKACLDKQAALFRKLLTRFFLISFVMSLVLLLGNNIVDIKVRWILPFVFLFPFYFFLGMERVSVSRRKQIIFSSLIVIACLATLLSLYGRVFFAGSRNKYVRLNRPYDRLAEEIKQQGFHRGLIIAHDYVLGANLKQYFKDSIVITPDEKMPFTYRGQSATALLVWEEEFTQSVRDKLFAIAGEAGFNAEPQEPRTLQARYHYSHDAMYHIFTVIKERTSG
ncbi:MAG: glycosyltransferase family 39 protein [Candidatus Omnitrophica bacterium]|nr:glycosyltransferase family 39 protein [Candidatus Omnitrophota bacterium]